MNRGPDLVLCIIISGLIIGACVMSKNTVRVKYVPRHPVPSLN